MEDLDTTNRMMNQKNLQHHESETNRNTSIATAVTDRLRKFDKYNGTAGTTDSFQDIFNRFNIFNLVL